MQAPRPLYIFAKPPEETALDAEQRQRELGLAGDYGRERFHTTILPLCDAREAPAGLISVLETAFAAMLFEPCAILFDRLHRNALRGGRELRDLRELQRKLVKRLTAMGLHLPPYRFRPHMTLAYGTAPERTLPIAPIGWHVRELQLVKSIHGKGRHETLARFELVLRQGSFCF
ncbi:2'-5' RNA ligase family protein [Sphingomonas sp. MMS12-HWE2-04]|uniref:2'-5' RNA ligase family protein n=1 Tax=Sphingomonas sp. MMS12-HWE2-04 TaxID=3234199 RepID=UPI00384C3E0B